MPTSLSSASSSTGQIYLEERNVAGGEEEKEWVFAPESDNVVILVPYQVKTQSAKRATNVLPKSNESVPRIGEPSFLSFNVRACGIRRPLHHHLLPGWNLGQLQALVFKLWDLLWVRKEGESKVERNWFSVSANGKNVPASSLATQSLSRGFCMRERGSSLLSYSIPRETSKPVAGSWSFAAPANDSLSSKVMTTQTRIIPNRIAFLR